MGSENIVFAVVVSFNPDVKILRENLIELKKQVNGIILVDNNSLNKNDFIPSISNLCTIIRLEENLGLSKAQNDGVIEAKKQNSTHVIIFDQDSIISKDFVEKQLQCEAELLSNGVKVAGVGPSFYDRESGYVYPATVYKGPFLKKINFHNKPVEVTFIIASGALIRISVLEDVGLMREDFFIDFVDVEWSIRAKYLGYNSYMNPNVTMEHNIGDQRLKVFGRLISIHSDFRKYYISRNSLFMIRLKYIPLGYKLRVFVFNSIRSFISVFVSDSKFNSFNAIVKGWKDGLGYFKKDSKWIL